MAVCLGSSGRPRPPLKAGAGQPGAKKTKKKGPGSKRSTGGVQAAADLHSYVWSFAKQVSRWQDEVCRSRYSSSQENLSWDWCCCWPDPLLR